MKVFHFSLAYSNFQINITMKVETFHYDMIVFTEYVSSTTFATTISTTYKHTTMTTPTTIWTPNTTTGNIE